MSTTSISEGVQSSFTNEVKYAGFWKRLIAYLVDYSIITIISFVLTISLFGSGGMSKDFEYIIDINQSETFEELKEITDEYQVTREEGSSTGIATVFSIVLILIYQALFLVNYDGATPGRRLLGIKVIKNDNTPITYPVVIVRFLSSILSSFVLFLGYLSIAFDKKKRGWHDRIAKTLVIQTKEKSRVFLGVIISLIVPGILISIIASGIIKMVDITSERIENVKTERSIEIPEDQKIHHDKIDELLSSVGDDQTTNKKIYADIITEYESLVELDPNNPEYWYNLANANTYQTATSSWEDYLEAAQKADELSPSNVKYVSAVAMGLLNTSQFEDSILKYKEAIRLDETSGFLHQQLGAAYSHLSMFDLAREHAEIAIERYEAKNEDGSFDKAILNLQSQIKKLPR